jgi:abelson tyrosine-protein kinase 1/abelson tyrosine-protein kinase 2
MTLAQAANILVDDDTSCVISDFGQSEMKSEVYRLTCASQPRALLSCSL